MLDFKFYKNKNMLISTITINNEISIEINCFRKKSGIDDYRHGDLTKGIFEIFLRKNGRYAFIKEMVNIHPDYYQCDGILHLRKNELFDYIKKIKRYYKVND